MSVTKRMKGFFAIAVFLVAVSAFACGQDGKDLDNYKWRVEGDWWLSHPSGFFGTNGSNNYVNVNRDLGFNSYSTFSGKIDWRFRRKHHLLFSVAPVVVERTRTIDRTIEFQGQTFALGTDVNARIKSLNFSPGYQYDILRRNHGYLGLEVDINLLDTEATLKAAATANGQGVGTSASRSLFAPLPAVGPTGRWYPLHDSNRLSLEGSVRGMYLFGYGDFLSARANVGVGLTDHLALRAGYQMGSRLSVHGTSDQIAVRLTQKGPTAGLEYSWGESEPAKTPSPVPQEPSDWHVDWIPLYLWFSGIQGDVGVKGYVVPVNVSFSQVLSQLNIALMSALDVRRKRVGLFTDLLYMSASSDQKSTPVGAAYAGFKANAKSLFVDPEVYLRLLDKDGGSVDVLAGARFWHMDNSLDLLPGTFPELTVGQTQNWVDPVLGARFRVNFLKNWFANLKGDAGGFGVGSKVTWQIYSGVGREFKTKYSMLLGYRYLDVDYKSGGFLYDTHMSGLLVGFGIRFK